MLKKPPKVHETESPGVTPCRKGMNRPPQIFKRNISQNFLQEPRKRCAVFVGMVINDVPLGRVLLAGQDNVAPSG
jgi:hypothetical protein